MVCTLNDHRNDVKMFRTWDVDQEGAQSFEHSDVISMAGKSIDNGKWLSICSLQ